MSLSVSSILGFRPLTRYIGLYLKQKKQLKLVAQSYRPLSRQIGLYLVAYHDAENALMGFPSPLEI